MINDIKEFAHLLQKLGEPDKNFRVLGFNHHKYKLRPKLSEAELHRFEQMHGIILTEDYRLFLSEVGNGGAGPFYGLESWHDAARCRNLSEPFSIQ